VFNGPSPETGEETGRRRRTAGRRASNDLPAQPAVFAPDYAPDEIREIAQKLRKRAGLPDGPTGEVANGGPKATAKPKPKAKAKAKAKARS
jgi:hypothetical protein